MANYAKEFNLVCFSLNKKYRSHIEIIALILEALKYGHAGRYLLMKNTSVNYSQLKKYLKLLSRIGFIETNITEDNVFYKASELGLAYLRQYGILRDMLIGASSRVRAAELMPEQHASAPFATQLVKRK